MDPRLHGKTCDVVVEVGQCPLNVFLAVSEDSEVWWTQV